MRAAVLSDIHGNLAALQAVLNRIDSEGADIVVCLGDIIGYGPFPNECIELIRTASTIAVRGNHDAGVLGDAALGKFNTHGRVALEWTRSLLTNQNEAYLRSLPLTTTKESMTFAHASPVNPEQWPYVTTWKDAQRIFESCTTRFCCIGHTHVPMIVVEDGTGNAGKKGFTHLINAGSVGQPRDGNPNASFVLVDTTEENSTRLIRVTYEIAATTRAIRAAGLPEFLARRLELGI